MRASPARWDTRVRAWCHCLRCNALVSGSARPRQLDRGWLAWAGCQTRRKDPACDPQVLSPPAPLPEVAHSAIFSSLTLQESVRTLDTLDVEAAAGTGH